MINYRVLVADDDDSLRETLAALLEFEGYSVQTACDGARALFMTTQLPPDVVLLDVRMPLLDGWGFMRELEKRGLHVPVLAMTAAEDMPYVDELRADVCVGKPFDLEVLLPAIARLCAEQRAA